MATSDESDDNSSLEEKQEGGDKNTKKQDTDGKKLSELERRLMKRVLRLEGIVTRQEAELNRLKLTCERLRESAEAFARVVQLLREAGLESSSTSSKSGPSNIEQLKKREASPTKINPENRAKNKSAPSKVIESFDDSMIFGTAPSSVIDAADAAGAAVLAAMLGGKQRMIVDVRDAELSTDPETLVQFIELTILPIAAGLEGLKSTRNRVKIVFPKVSQLLEYRRTMALAAPEVVGLSTLGFDPVEKRDKLVVIVAPEPDDEEGFYGMKELLSPSDPNKKPIEQPVVLLNYHMVPVAAIPVEFETAYHLRLLTVQYMSGEVANEYFHKFQEEGAGKDTASSVSGNEKDDDGEEIGIEDEALEAAMKHAHEVGMNRGVTRAMVIRAYPRPWHVFVDTSPDTDADFEVAATFDKEPTFEELNIAIVECLEGSEREDEIVAQQMQQALEEGQLDKVSDMIGEALNRYGEGNDEDDDDNDNDKEDDFDMYEEDSV